MLVTTLDIGDFQELTAILLITSVDTVKHGVADQRLRDTFPSSTLELALRAWPSIWSMR